MPTGKHTLTLEFNVQHIDLSILHFHKDLLTPWLHHTKPHTRTNPPATLADILHEPLFKNPLYYREWIKAELLLIKDICYSVIPGFLPDLAIHEILTRHNENTTRSLQQTKHELRELQRALPNYWTRLIRTHITTRQLSLQPLFAIPNSQPNAESIPLENCRTRHFYQHLLGNKQTPIPSLHRWQQLTNPPDFNHLLEEHSSDSKY